MEQANVVSMRSYKLRMHEKKVQAHTRLVKAGYASAESLFALMREVNQFVLPLENEQNEQNEPGRTIANPEGSSR